MSKTITQTALELYKAPFSFYCGYIHDADGKTVADDGAIGDKPDEIKTENGIVRVRGWGHIQKLKTDYGNSDIQDEVGRLIAVALTEFWEKNNAA